MTYKISAKARAAWLIRNDPDYALELAVTLMGQMNTAPFPRLKVTTVKDDGETYTGLRCPRCHSLVDDLDGGIQVLDWAVYTTGSDEIHPDENHHVMQYDHEAEFETLYYSCGSCDKPVRLPEDWKEDNA